MEPKGHGSSKCLKGNNSIKLQKHVGYYYGILMYKNEWGC